MHDRDWDWDVIADHLPQNILLHIASFELAEKGVVDNFVWEKESSGQFSLKSAVALIRKDSKCWTTMLLEVGLESQDTTKSKDVFLVNVEW